MKERRKTSRHRTLRRGTILFNDGRSAIDCTVRNMSEGGGCLEVENPIGPPDRFELTVAGEGLNKKCEVAWRSGKRIGVSFHETAEQDNDRYAEIPSMQAKFEAAPDHAGAELVRNELLTLRAALDEVSVGIVLLDAELRAQFINRCYRKMWRLPDAKADSKPAFISLLHHGRDTCAYEIRVNELERYIAERVAYVKAGAQKPVDIRLASGEVLRFQCTVLPAGGRMLSYTYVTDIVRHSDELETLRAALDEVEAGLILLDSHLNAQFINRAARVLWHVTDEQAESHQPFSQLVNKVRHSGTYGVPKDQVEDFVASKLDRIRRGDSAPSDLRLSDGRTVRSQCAVLPNGGRLLTYTDVTDLVRQGDELQRLATIDSLTGLYNRRHFQVLAEAEWSRFQRYNRPLSLLIFDIDHFKLVNDLYGHDVGDRALAHLAALCRQNKRASDVFARLGGDEFAALLPETDLVQAHSVAERMRQALVDAEFFGHDKRVAITVSIGAASATLSMAGIHSLIKNADQALYKAKAEGRNRTVLARLEPMAKLPLAAE
jgi:diguanylate cyclase (GGDEF)-like protein